MAVSHDKPGYLHGKLVTVPYLSWTDLSEKENHRRLWERLMFRTSFTFSWISCRFVGVNQRKIDYREPFVKQFDVSTGSAELVETNLPAGPPRDANQVMSKFWLTRRLLSRHLAAMTISA